jgi:hypothetical protein
MKEKLCVVCALAFVLTVATSHRGVCQSYPRSATLEESMTTGPSSTENLAEGVATVFKPFRAVGSWFHRNVTEVDPASPAGEKGLHYSPFTPREFWWQNRLWDFMDIFSFGAGVTQTNPVTGPFPPSLGLYVQATDFVHLGALGFGGMVAEMEGRGLGVYDEVRMRWGIGPWNWWHVDQGRVVSRVNLFKDAELSAEWQRRMHADQALWVNDAPAKNLIHKVGTDDDFGTEENDVGRRRLFSRGWHAWEDVRVEMALCDPFLQHLGFTLRVGVDPSEFFYCLLGFVGLDPDQDDLRLSDVFVEDAAPAEVAPAAVAPAAAVPDQPALPPAQE